MVWHSRMGDWFIFQSSVCFGKHNRIVFLDIAQNPGLSFLKKRLHRRQAVVVLNFLLMKQFRYCDL